MKWKTENIPVSYKYSESFPSADIKKKKKAEAC